MRIGWLLRRLLHSAVLLFAVSAFSFLLAHFAPGQFFDDLRLNPQIAPETVRLLRARYGLDSPLPRQYANWVASAARGDLGTSLAWQQPVAPILLPRLRSTLLLTGSAAALAWVFGVPLGLLAARKPRSLASRLGSGFSSLLLATPELLLILLLMFAAIRLGVPGLLTGFPLPLGVLVAGMFPLVFLHTRSAAEEVLDSGFVRSARAHGIRGSRLWLRYILPAAGNPLISLFGLSIGGLIGASLIVETVLSRPGLGPLFLDAISNRDLDVVTAVMLLSSGCLIVGNLLADLLLAWNDPRIAWGGQHE